VFQHEVGQTMYVTLLDHFHLSFAIFRLKVVTETTYVQLHTCSATYALLQQFFLQELGKLQVALFMRPKMCKFGWQPINKRTE